MQPMTRATKIAVAVAALLLGVLLALRSSRWTPDAVGHVGEAERVVSGADAPITVRRARPLPSGGRAADTDHLAERRRQLRQLLLSAAGSSNGESNAPGSGPFASAPQRRPALADDVDSFAHAIAATIRSDFGPMAEGCYRELLGRVPQGKGSVVMRFEVLADASLGGVVNEADLTDDSTLRDHEFDTCLRESFLALDFDSLRTAGRVTMRFPFEFAEGKVDASYEPHLKDRRPGRERE